MTSAGRRRTQYDSNSHRGRKLPLMDAERLDDTGWDPLRAALDKGGPTIRSPTAAKAKRKSVPSSKPATQSGRRTAG